MLYWNIDRLSMAYKNKNYKLVSLVMKGDAYGNDMILNNIIKLILIIKVL